MHTFATFETPYSAYRRVNKSILSIQIQKISSGFIFLNNIFDKDKTENIYE